MIYVRLTDGVYAQYGAVVDLMEEVYRKTTRNKDKNNNKPKKAREVLKTTEQKKSKKHQ